MKENLWIIRKLKKRPTFRLFCFCYAGGSAVGFMEWDALIHPRIEICAIQLPGRGARFHEPPYSTIGRLIPDLARAMKGLDDLPCAFFGHSLGGLIAFELARYYRQHCPTMPQHLFVSGCAAPQHRSKSKGLHELDDEQLLEELANFNGTPPEVLEQRELMELILPTIRADFALAERYAYLESQPLGVPMTVLAGEKDKFDSPEQVSGWSMETSAGCDVEWFEGDHFFIHQQVAQVVRCVNSRLMPPETYVGAC